MLDIKGRQYFHFSLSVSRIFLPRNMPNPIHNKNSPVASQPSDLNNGLKSIQLPSLLTLPETLKTALKTIKMKLAKISLFDKQHTT